MVTKWKPIAVVLATASIVLSLQLAIFGLTDKALAADDSVDANPTLTIAHFAPFASEVVSTSVTVRVVGVGDVITDFVFGEIETDISALSAGTYTIEIVPTGSITPAITGTVTIADDTDYTVAAIGNVSNQPLELEVYVDDNSIPPAGKSRVRIAHLAPFSNTLAGTAVDLCAAIDTPLETDLQYQESITPELDAGIYSSVFIATAGDNCASGSEILPVPAFAAREGAVSYVYAIGDASNQPLQIAQTGLQARVAVAHFAPFAANVPGTSVVPATSVSVKLAGTEIISDFVFSQIWPDDMLSYVNVGVGSYLVEVIPTGSVDPAITGTAVISGFVDFTLAAIGDGSNQSLELVRFEDDNTTPPPTGKGRVRVGHLAPFANTLVGTTVDLCTSVGGAPLLDNVQYKQDGILELDLGTYTSVFIGKAEPNCSEVILPIPTFIVAEGDVAYLYAIGDNANFPVSATATPQSILAARVAVAHLAPFASTTEGTAVDIQLNGADVLTDVTYPQITSYLTVKSGEYFVAVTPSNDVASAADPAITGTVKLAPAIDYTLAAIGDGTNQPLELKPSVDDNSTPPTGKGRVRVSHLAPFANTLEGTTVDLCTSVDGTPLLDNVQYKQDGTLELDPGLYSSVFIGKASPNCSEVILPIPPFVVSDGGVGYLYAIGDGPNFPVSATSAPPSVFARFLSLPAIYK